jgi:Xaa-His dipeptidase
MPVLSDLEPREVFAWFERLCAIPHSSHHAKAISDYLVAFARERGLACRQDAANNVVIRKAASAGYENALVVMLQGHIDMVCEKDADCGKDMETEGLDLFVDGDGIAVAMALAVLDADDIPHGPLECVFTADEEVGMIGARALDASALKAKYLINIDSEEERVLTVSCAGACRTLCTLPVTRVPFDGETLRVKISGLVGGHSGEEIHKGRANANLLLGRALDEMSRAGALRLIRVSGGAKDNAIPREAEAVVRTGDAAALRRAVEALAAALRAEYHVADGHITVTVTETDDGLTPMDAASTERAITLLLCAPNGVVEMSMDVPDLVQTSLNLGRLTSDEASLRASFMIRSSINSQKNAVASRLARLAEALGGQTELDSDYSAWPYRPESPLRDRVAEVFYEQYGEKPRIAALHAGLECGILSGKLPELDCISLGPDLTDIHTPRERLYIASTERTWRLLLGTLKRLDA